MSMLERIYGSKKINSVVANDRVIDYGVMI